MPTPRVAHVLAPGPYGGAESVLRALVMGARSAGREVMAALLLDDGVESPLAAELRSVGAHVEEIRCGHRAYRAETRELRRALEAWGATLVHTHVYHADFVGYFAARRLGLPVVATVHGTTGGSLRNRFYQWADFQLMRRMDAVLCVSTSLRDRLLAAGCKASRLHVVANGFAPAAFLARGVARAALGVGGDGPVVGWVGRVSAEKGPDLFVDALALVRTPGVRGVMVGDGPEHASTLRRAAAVGATGGAGVTLAGSRPGAGALMRAFDLLVLSSRTEGVPMVLLEAMAAGVPVATFLVGGIPDVVDGLSAWPAPAADVAALAAAIDGALGDGEAARRRAAVAMTRLEQLFGLARWIGEIDRVYATLSPGNG